MRPFRKITLTALTLGVIGLSTAPMVQAEAHATLKQIMQHLGQAMGTVSDALWREDFPTIAKAAGEIAGHHHLSPHELQHLRQVLGREMARFEAMDHAAHLAAEDLKAAAEVKEMAIVLRQHARLQQACVACHTAFRPQVLDAK